jgi:death-on-curing protein
VTPSFLTAEEALAVHAFQIQRFGGSAGMRDSGLLESALAQPQASFEGALLCEDLFQMAAAYLFHLVSNHPFVDGNKRTGLHCALLFLDLNGVRIDQGTDALYALTMAVARGELEKPEVAARLAKLAD